MKEKDKAYIAALIDGEGYLNIDKQMRARLEITNRNADLMFWLTQRFGGSFHIVYRKARPEHPCFRWELTGKYLIDLLFDILGFLKIKRNRAAEMLEWWKRVKNGAE